MADCTASETFCTFQTHFIVGALTTGLHSCPVRNRGTQMTFLFSLVLCPQHNNPLNNCSFPGNAVPCEPPQTELLAGRGHRADTRLITLPVQNAS